MTGYSYRGKSGRRVKRFKQTKYDRVLSNTISRSKVTDLISSDQTMVQMKMCTTEDGFYNIMDNNRIFYSGNDLFAALPTGYNQWTYLYNRYTVLGSKIKVHFANLQDHEFGYQYPVEYAVCPLYYAGDRDSYTKNNITNFVTLKNQKYCKTATAGPKSSLNAIATIESYMSTAKIAGKRSVVEEHDFSGRNIPDSIISGHPERCWFWLVAAYCAGFPSFALKVDVYTEITYYVMLHDRRKIDVS